MFLFACLFTVRVKRKVYLKREKQKGELEKIKTQDKEKSPPLFFKGILIFLFKTGIAYDDEQKNSCS